MKSPFGRNLQPGLAVLVLVDLLAAVVAGILLSGGRMDGAGLSAVNGSALRALPIGFSFVTALAVCGLYQAHAWFTARRLFGRGILAMLLLVLGVELATRFAAAAPSRQQVQYWAIPAFYMALAVALRFGLAAALRAGLVRPRLALIRSCAAARPAAFDDVPPEWGAAPPELPVLLNDPGGMGAGLAAKDLRRSGIRAAVAADHDVMTPAIRGECAAAGVRVMTTQEFRELRHRRVDIDTLAGDWLETAAVSRQGRAAALLRRGFDVVGSVILLLLTLPVLLLTALAIRIESPGPIFYRQERVGQHGRVFRLFKFRSMSVDAEKGGPRWAVPSDPRVTRVGRLIRLTRIDEIPQALNVLRGEMALIGPRPERPAFVEHLAAVIPHYASRSVVRPGITGWAQINYPYGASVEDARNKLAYDLYYLRHRGLALDVAIVLGTIRVILLQEGAR